MKTFLMICLFVISFPSIAADGLIGRVTKLRGNVVKIHGSEQVILKEGDNLYSGDEIHTQNGSFIKVIMRDDTVFQLGAKSSFKFGEFSFKSKDDRRAVYELMQGKLRSLFTVPAKEGDLKLNTPTASMGIRGTEILSDVYKFNGVLKTDIALLKGKLDVAINEKTYSLKAGEMIEANKFGLNSERAPMPPPSVREIPRAVFAKLQKAEKKGGEVFLFDAKNEKTEMQPSLDSAPVFKNDIREKLEVKEFQAPKEGMKNDKRNNEIIHQTPNHPKPEGPPSHGPGDGPHKPRDCREDRSCPPPPPPPEPPKTPKTPPVGGETPPLN